MSKGNREDALFHLLRRVMQAHTAAWQHQVPDLTKPQYATLDAVRRHPGIDQVTLGTLAATDKGTTTELLRRLEHLGWTTRTRSETDQRRRHVRLTAEGERVADHAAERARTLNAAFLAPLGDDDRDRLRDLLSRLADTPETPDAVAGPDPSRPAAGKFRGERE